jgi:hypothetical protein
MAKVARTLKQKVRLVQNVANLLESIGKNAFEIGTPTHASIVYATASFHACRAESTMTRLVRRGNARRGVGWSRRRRPLDGYRRARRWPLEKGFLVTPVQRQQVQAETGQEE